MNKILIAVILLFFVVHTFIEYRLISLLTSRTVCEEIGKAAAYQSVIDIIQTIRNVNGKT